MIRTITTHACPRCGSSHLAKNGHNYKGPQKFRCKACGRYGTLEAQSGYGSTTRHCIKQAVTERLSLRGVERVFGISRRTVSRWRQHWIKHVPPLEQHLVEAQIDDVLELDELVVCQEQGTSALDVVGLVSSDPLGGGVLDRRSIRSWCHPLVGAIAPGLRALSFIQ
jgi:transposase-like protein